ncbi:hypothetical protein GOQ27_11540 [Clostridium sp. D2Q-11]|uniref:Uncharacterized protein n=1 Tax=Anaeromonas frigoriresistens TaxID=2683708 RepID=A0A942UTS5_9FIRM|nr:hypothetical protein [Anaeromonas frigoriresistens]MBS4539099.1 hypothetical protein [Anaeromonas frigoriresistens]
MLSSISKNELYNKSVLFLNNDYNKAKIEAKNYIIKLSKNNQKVILLDSFWSKEKYNRFKNSKYKENIEGRYHIKLSVEDFLSRDNLIEYMNEKNINIIKIKSILGYMSAAELFPVIISRLNSVIKDETIHVLINDYVLENLEWSEVVNALNSVNKNNIKFIVITNRDAIPTELVEKCEIVMNK